MAKDDEPVDDLHPVAWVPITDMFAPVADVPVPISDLAVPVAEVPAPISEAPAPIADVSTESPVPRLDYGDADQRAEMDEIKDVVQDVSVDEPVELVDSPIQIREPFGRAEKRRNQRRMPT